MCTCIILLRPNEINKKNSYNCIFILQPLILRVKSSVLSFIYFFNVLLFFMFCFNVVTDVVFQTEINCNVWNVFDSHSKLLNRMKLPCNVILL